MEETNAKAEVQSLKVNEISILLILLSSLKNQHKKMNVIYAITSLKMVRTCANSVKYIARLMWQCKLRSLMMCTVLIISTSTL